MVERATVQFADGADPHRWDLRVTELFTRDDDGWRRIHRHGDPMVDRHSLEEILPLLP